MEAQKKYENIFFLFSFFDFIALLRANKPSQNTMDKI